MPSHNPMQLNDKVILVTGASSGIGRATAILCSQLGAKVILTGRNISRLNDTLKSMEGQGHGIHSLDISQHTDFLPWMRDLAKNYGPLNGLAHCAGILTLQPLRGLSPETLTDLMKTNFESAVWLTKAFRHNKVCSKETASIVYVSSAAGMVGEKGNAIYGASKAALISITKAYALELAEQNIRVNSVVPAIVQTEMIEETSQKVLSDEQFQKIVNAHPIGLGTPEDVANSISFLLSEASRWITGTSLVVDGGYTAD